MSVGRQPNLYFAPIKPQRDQSDLSKITQSSERSHLLTCVRPQQPFKKLSLFIEQSSHLSGASSHSPSKPSGPAGLQTDACSDLHLGPTCICWPPIDLSFQPPPLIQRLLSLMTCLQSLLVLIVAALGPCTQQLCPDLKFGLH